jgi:hypothetical protein
VIRFPYIDVMFANITTTSRCGGAIVSEGSGVAHSPDARQITRLHKGCGDLRYVQVGPSSSCCSHHACDDISAISIPSTDHASNHGQSPQSDQNDQIWRPSLEPGPKRRGREPLACYPGEGGRQSSKHIAIVFHRWLHRPVQNFRNVPSSG